MTQRSKILIVDDEPFNVDYLEQELEELDCETIAAANGQEALEAVEVELPDLILLDVMMPVMDGREATRIIRSKKKTKNIPILATTAITEKSQLRECIEAGCNDYLLKPFAPNDLSSTPNPRRLRSMASRPRIRFDATAA